MADDRHDYSKMGDREVEHATQYCLTLCGCGAVTFSLIDAGGNTFAVGTIDPLYVRDWLTENMDGIGQTQGAVQ